MAIQSYLRHTHVGAGLAYAIQEYWTRGVPINAGVFPLLWNEFSYYAGRKNKMVVVLLTIEVNTG